MFCPSGSIRVEFNNGKEQKNFILDKPNKILVVEKGYWREFVSLEEGSVLCVGASEIYDEKDYIRDYKKYLDWIEKEDKQ